MPKLLPFRRHWVRECFRFFLNARRFINPVSSSNSLEIRNLSSAIFCNVTSRETHRILVVSPSSLITGVRILSQYCRPSPSPLMPAKRAFLPFTASLMAFCPLWRTSGGNRSNQGIPKFFSFSLPNSAIQPERFICDTVPFGRTILMQSTLTSSMSVCARSKSAVSRSIIARSCTLVQLMVQSRPPELFSSLQASNKNH